MFFIIGSDLINLIDWLLETTQFKMAAININKHKHDEVSQMYRHSSKSVVVAESYSQLMLQEYV